MHAILIILRARAGARIGRIVVDGLRWWIQVDTLICVVYSRASYATMKGVCNDAAAGARALTTLTMLGMLCFVIPVGPPL